MKKIRIKMIRYGFNIMREWCILHKNVAIYYSYILLGAFIISLVIYYRFLRHRAVRDIPFMLNEWGFCALLFACLSYLYVIFRLLKPKQAGGIFLQVILFFGRSLGVIYNILRKNRFTVFYYNKVISFMVHEIIYPKYIRDRNLIFLMKIIPMYLLVIVFLCDVFLFQHIQFFYYFIFLGILPLMYSLIMYAFQVAQQEYFREMNSRYASILIEDKPSRDKFYETGDPTTVNPKAIHHETMVSIEKYIEIQIDNEYMIYNGRENNDWDVKYEGFPICNDIYEKEYRIKNQIVGKLSIDDDKILDKYFNENISLLQEITVYLNLRQISYDVYLKLLLITLYFLYLIAWLYILIKSIHTLKVSAKTIIFIQSLTNYAEMLNPFIN